MRINARVLEPLRPRELVEEQRPHQLRRAAQQRSRARPRAAVVQRSGAAPEDARPAPGTPVRPSARDKSAPATTTVVTPTKVGHDEWRRDGVGGHTPEDFYARAAALKGAPTTQRSAGVGVVDLQPLHLRTDAHPSSGSNSPALRNWARPGGKALGDCLHFCTPGPMDHLAPQLLLHAMVARDVASTIV